MIVSASDLTRTRLCRAENCERDAENYSHLCYRCQRSPKPIRLQGEHPISPPTLRCGSCDQFKPDEAFSKSITSTHARRKRSSECKACAKKRRLIARQNPAVLARERATQNRYRARLRAELDDVREQQS